LIRINAYDVRELIADGECRIGVKAMIEKVGFTSLQETPLPIHRQPANFTNNRTAKTAKQRSFP
jgi:hypothetical protein